MKLSTVRQVTTRFNPVACFSAKLSMRRPGRGEIKATVEYLKRQGVVGKHDEIAKNAYGQISRITSNGVNITNKCIDALIKG